MLYDLRDRMISEDHPQHGQMIIDNAYHSDEEHSVLEDDSDGEERDDYLDDDDGSSSLSIPNESIDFDLVYALHSFAATVEGQANVVKGDSLFLMDDSNSYWWLVRVLKTQEVGYIPAENIETPFERLARLNKHRNVDLASATQTELQETRDRLRDNLSSRAGSNQATPSPTPGRAGSRNRSRSTKGVAFTPSFSVHRYPPAVWGDEEEEDEDVEWDDEPYSDEDPELAEEQEERERTTIAVEPSDGMLGMEPDDGMSWEDHAVQRTQETQQHREDTTEPSPQPPVSQSLQQSKQEETPIRKQPSPERLTIIPDEAEVVAPAQHKTLDPMQATETRKISITPLVAQSSGPLLPSAILQQQQEEHKRTREEIEALEESSRKRANKGTKSSTPPEQPRPSGGAKLRKERDREQLAEDDNSKDKKKKSGGVFGGLFGRRKDKKDKISSGNASETSSAISGGSSIDIRDSEESGRSSSQQHMVGQPETPPRQQAPIYKNDGPVTPQQQRPIQKGEQTLNSAITQSPLSQHASQLRQRDQQQQALYQQYLNRSPATPPEAQPSYGLQSASAIMSSSSSFISSPGSSSALGVGSSRPRPGSLIISPSAIEGQGGVGLPDLSVIRVFAGDNLQTEATFKTVLLNTSTTASDLVRQAIQRFRLPSGETEKDYYLTIKQLEGSSLDLRPEEKPLGVFETLVEEAMELPKVKRSSVGSISSVASNLSLHPAIKKLSMSDFTDDSAVKFYLNRKSTGIEESADEGDVTLLAESTHDDEPETPRSPGLLSVNSTNSVAPDRFSSPSAKFSLQLVIHPEDLPDDMVFDSLTEAIVFKNTIRERTHLSTASSSSGVSQSQRRKVFIFPKNITVAEVIELGLERFGIVDGVVDGGDEVEDKLTKRRSSSRVRYGLTVIVGSKERELSPSGKVIDAFPRMPTFRTVERRDLKRRSVDSAQLLLGNPDDISPDDPIFTLRRAIAYRSSSRHRSSAPLDEIALQNLHRESMSSSAGSDSTAGPNDDSKQRQPSKQEIIAAQRAATRANQRAILSTHLNSVRGLDVILPGNAMLRSSRFDVDDKMRYSYVEPDGETYDISDIVEEEWRNETREKADASNDLLHGVLSRGKDGLGARLDRVLSKIKHERVAGRSPAHQDASSGSVRSNSPSVYSTAEGGPASRAVTPNANILNAKSPTPTSQRFADTSTTTRTPHRRQQSALSVASDASAGPTSRSHQGKGGKPMPLLPRDFFGVPQMLAVIESRVAHQENQKLPPLDAVDELLFGRTIDPNALHPDIREIYSGSFKLLEEMEQKLDVLLDHVSHAL
ncbi:Cell Polarity and Bud Site Selection Regulator [Abortiporus biennis]